MITASFKKLVKAGFRQAGFSISRNNNNPMETLLGLRTRRFNAVIDVGANTGQFAKEISGFFPNASIYCFEPLPDPFAELLAWARTEHGRVVPFNVAIGDKDGEVEMFLHESHTPSSSLLATTALTEQYYPFTKGQKRVSVRQMTLDAALDEKLADLSPEILIKLDVQGYEDKVIAGGRNVFSKASACILEVSLDTLYEDQADFKGLLMNFDALGYRYVGNLSQVYGEDGHFVYVDAVFSRKPETGR